MKTGLSWDEIEKPDQEEFRKFIQVCNLLTHPNPVVLLNRKYGIAKHINGGFGFIVAMDVTDFETNQTEERWFGVDMSISEFSKLCQSVSDEEITIAMANKVLNKIKLR